MKFNSDGNPQGVQWFGEFDWVPLAALPSLGKSQRAGFRGGSDDKLVQARGAAAAEISDPQQFLAMFDQRLGKEWEKVLHSEAKPKSSYTIRYWPLPQEGKVPFVTYRKAAQLHALRSAALHELRRPADALKEVEGGFRLIRGLEESGEDSLVCYMIQVAISGLMVEPVWDGLVNGRWSDEELSALQADLGKVLPARRWPRAINTELAWENTILDSLAEMSPKGRLTVLQNLFGTKNRFSPALLGTITGVIRESQLAANEWLDAARAQIDEAGQFHQVSHLKYDFENMSSFERHRYLLACIMSPNTERAAIRVAATTARVRQAAIAVAIERYRRVHQVLPEKLDAIALDLRSEVIVDPFDGKPMRYAPDSGRTYRLWSIGDNKVDDGGKPSNSDGPGAEFDLVWPGADFTADIRQAAR
jgi:hypothetical protein